MYKKSCIFAPFLFVFADDMVFLSATKAYFSGRSVVPAIGRLPLLGVLDHPVLLGGVQDVPLHNDPSR